MSALLTDTERRREVTNCTALCTNWVHALRADKCKSRGTTRGSATRKEEKKMKKILLKLSTLMITPNYEKYK